MPSHKVLKSVVRNIMHSFTSTLNYYDGEYVDGHIVQAAWQTGGSELRVNLLTGDVNESALLTKPVKYFVKKYVERFPDFVSRSQSSMEFITSAELSITIDPTQRRLYKGTSFFESPVTFKVQIVDDRGKIYSHTISDWWFPENQ